MARSGRFGRQPRQAASLTNTLVSIAREFQNQRAENIMSAWQKGGTFEGKKATDSVVLAFWKDKMAGVSKDDPLYDTYKNAHSQLDYTIHESKMTAGYAMKKYSDGDMVKFYLGWAKKVPKDSEFYRVLQRDAGQYMRTVKANNEAEIARQKELRYQKQQDGTRKSMEAAGEYVIDTLRRIAQSGNSAHGIAPTIAAPGSGSDLTDFDPSDPNVMLNLIALIAPRDKVAGPYGSFTEGKAVGSDEVLYHDDDKKPVTGADIIKKLQGLDPSFTPGVPFDVNYVTGLLDRQVQGLNERIARAKKTGHMTDVANLQKSKGYVAMLNREVEAYPVQKAYQEARADYDAIVTDKTSSPAAVLKAWDEYAATLTRLSNDPRIEADDNLRSRLAAEVAGAEGVPTLHESFTGLANGQFDPSSAKDAAENAAAIEFMRQQVDAVASGGAVWTYGETKNGVFVPKAGGREIGAATPQAVIAGGLNPQTITIDDPLGGAPITMTVTAVPVYATAKDPETGDPLPTSNSNPIAWAYDIPHGDSFQTQYGFQTKDGFHFSSDPNWDERLPVTASSSGGNHLEVDLTDVIAQRLGYADKDPITGKWGTKPDLTKDEDLPGGLHVRGTNEWDDATGTFKRGEVIFDPQDAAWSTDTRDGLGSTDPMTDFKSLTLSNLMSTDEGRSILSNLDKYPAFKNTLTNEAYTYAGAARDANGVIIPGTESPSKFAEAMGQVNMVTNAKSFNDFLSTAAKTWQRTATGSPFTGGQQGNQTGATGPEFTIDGFKKLATDRLQGTPFEALGNVFRPGTSTIKPAELSAQTGFTIKPATVIKTPTLPEVKVTSTTTTGPTAISTAVQQVNQQTGSTAPQTSSQSGSKPPSGGGTSQKYL